MRKKKIQQEDPSIYHKHKLYSSHSLSGSLSIKFNLYTGYYIIKTCETREIS